MAINWIYIENEEIYFINNYQSTNKRKMQRKQEIGRKKSVSFEGMEET